MLKLFLTLTLVTLSQSAPTSTSFKQVLSESADDVRNLVEAKLAVAQYTGEAVGEAASAAGSATVEFVGSIDPIQMTDDLEASVIAHKVSSIEALFDAKRALITALQEARNRHQAQIAAYYNVTVEGVNAALDTTFEGIGQTKEAVAEFASEITLENTQQVS